MQSQKTGKSGQKGSVHSTSKGMKPPVIRCQGTEQPFQCSIETKKGIQSLQEEIKSYIGFFNDLNSLQDGFLKKEGNYSSDSFKNKVITLFNNKPKYNNIFPHLETLSSNVKTQIITLSKILGTNQEVCQSIARLFGTVIKKCLPLLLELKTEYNKVFSDISGVKEIQSPPAFNMIDDNLMVDELEYIVFIKGIVEFIKEKKNQIETLKNQIPKDQQKAEAKAEEQAEEEAKANATAEEFLKQLDAENKTKTKTKKKKRVTKVESAEAKSAEEKSAVAKEVIKKSDVAGVVSYQKPVNIVNIIKSLSDLKEKIDNMNKNTQAVFLSTLAKECQDVFLDPDTIVGYMAHLDELESALHLESNDKTLEDIKLLITKEDAFANKILASEKLFTSKKKPEQLDQKPAAKAQPLAEEVVVKPDSPMEPVGVTENNEVNVTFNPISPNDVLYPPLTLEDKITALEIDISSETVTTDINQLSEIKSLITASRLANDKIHFFPENPLSILYAKFKERGIPIRFIRLANKIPFTMDVTEFKKPKKQKESLDRHEINQLQKIITVLLEKDKFTDAEYTESFKFLKNLEDHNLFDYLFDDSRVELNLIWEIYKMLDLNDELSSLHDKYVKPIEQG